MKKYPGSIKNCLKRHEDLHGIYGEIYMTNKLRFIFHCTLCLENFDTVLAYKKHVLSKHQIKQKYEEDDGDEKEINETINEREKNLTATCDDGKDPLEEINNSDQDDKFPLNEESIKFEKNDNPMKIALDYKCDECNQCYEHKRSLNMHKRLHAKKTYACTECNKKFVRDTEFKMHLLWHRGERPYICSWCGKNYRTVRALHIHERLHTNTRPYKCSYCERDFYKNRHLKEHVVTHTRERNHMCHICNSSFPRRKALKSHIKIHENKREHVCNICQAAYNQRPALYFHMKNKHNVLPLTTTTQLKSENKKI